MRLVVDVTNRIVVRHGGRPIDEAVVAAMTGMPIESIFRVAWPDLPDADAAAYRLEYRAIYDEYAVPATKLYRGAMSTLRTFHRAGLRQATVTGKRAVDCERILRGLGLRREIECYLGGDSTPRPKPAPDLALTAMAQLGVEATEAVVVGDTRTDMRMGRAAGAHTILVLWGVQKEFVPEADEMVRTWSELRERILGRNGPQRS